MKKKIEYITCIGDVYAEQLRKLAPDLHKYWAITRSHVEEKAPVAGAAYFFADFTAFKPEKTLAVIDITVDRDAPEVFWDWRIPEYGIRYVAHHTVTIKVNGCFAGYYLPKIHTLVATDWTHNMECVRLAKQVLPKLVQALHLSPLTDKQRREYLKAAGVEIPRRKRPRITVGCDPEFELWAFPESAEPRLLRAYDHFEMYGPLGTDGAGYQIEMRPDPRNSQAGGVEHQANHPDFRRAFPAV